MAANRPRSRRTYGTGSITERSPGRWHLRWSAGTDPFTGKPIRKSTTISAANRTEANKRLQQLTATTGDTALITFGALLDNALPNLRVEPSTKDRYSQALAHIPGPARAWRASHITPPQAQQLIDELAATTGAANIRKLHTAILSCWRQARLEGWIGDGNPWTGLHLPKPPKSAGQVIPDSVLAAITAELATTTGPRKPRRFGVGKATRQTVRRSIHDEYLADRCWFRLSLASGARPGEIVTVRWSHVDHDANVVVFTDEKHHGDPRPVLLDPATLTTVAAWQAAQRLRADLVGVDLDPDPWLFSSDPASGTHWTGQYARTHVWQPLLELAGQARTAYRPYDIRHTHNSWLNADNIDAAVRGARLGNSPALNERVYTHSINDQAAVDAITRRLGQ